MGEDVESELRLTREQYRQMRDHVQRCLPNEGCGMAGGRDGRVDVIIPVANALASPVRYEMEPVEQLQAMLRLEELGLDIAAIYHSHPSGPPHPSQTDMELNMYPDSVALIWWREEGEWRVRGFRIGEGVYNEVRLAWIDPA